MVGLGPCPWTVWRPLRRRTQNTRTRSSGVLVVPDIVGNLRSHFQDGLDAPLEVPPEDDPFAVAGPEGQRDEEKWKDILYKEKVEGGSSAVEVPFMIPLPNKSAPEVLQGPGHLGEGQGLGTLCHSDRGREFCNTAFKRFCLHRNIIRTTTTADDFRQNGRTEAYVGRLKAATRTLLAASR